MVTLKLDWKTVLATAGIVYVAGRLLAPTRETIDSAIDGLNPLNEGNWANRSFNAVWRDVFQTDRTPGETIYDWLHADSPPADNDIGGA